LLASEVLRPSRNERGGKGVSTEGRKKRGGGRLRLLNLPQVHNRAALISGATLKRKIGGRGVEAALRPGKKEIFCLRGEHERKTVRVRSGRRGKRKKGGKGKERTEFFEIITGSYPNEKEASTT